MQVEKRQIVMNKELSEEKGNIDQHYQQRREELLQERNMSDVTLTAMERVLDEIKSLNQQISEEKQQRTLLEDGMNETQFDRTRMEQKVSVMKQREITDQV